MSVPRSLLVLLLLALAAAARAGAPAWLEQTRGTPIPAGTDRDAEAVVLLDEQAITVHPDGLFTIRLRRAVRILTVAGKKHAVARVPYDTSSEKIQSFKAWIVRPDGNATAIDKKRILDIAVFTNALELYSEARARLAVGDNEAMPGDLFGYEAEIDQRSILAQRVWGFQGPLPIVRSALSVTLPADWNVEPHTFNHPAIPFVVTGKTRTWELRDQPAFKPEPLGPSIEGTVPWLALDLLPPANAKRPSRRAFQSWTDISTYLTPFYDQASVPDAPMQTRVAALTSRGESWDKIVALCRAAQEVNYISIQLDTARSGGAIPRPATRVFECNYGDCKDKATLLRALLRAAGIDAWALAVFSGDRNRVQPDWPSALQFNHCILAIRVDATIDAPAVIDHPALGRLLIFDPTDQYTPPGLLPQSDQGGYGLLLAGVTGGLIRLPLPTERHGFDRTIHAQLFADGSVKATVEEHFDGVSSSFARAEWRKRAASDYRDLITRWLARTLPAPTITRLAPEDDFVHAKFGLSVDVEARHYAKPMRDTLLIFKPVLVSRRTDFALKEKARRAPVVLELGRFTERAEFTLPPDFRVDEMPPPMALDTPFGRYTARTSAREGKLACERTLELRATTVPAADYEAVRTFFEKILQAEQSPVVLQRVEEPEPAP